MSVSKISIAVDDDLLRLARTAAEREGMSVSAYFTRALEKQLEHQRRLDAARELWATWDDGSIPTDEDRARFLAAMARPRNPERPRRKGKTP